MECDRFIVAFIRGTATFAILGANRLLDHRFALVLNCCCRSVQSSERPLLSFRTSLAEVDGACVVGWRTLIVCVFGTRNTL